MSIRHICRLRLLNRVKTTLVVFIFAYFWYNFSVMYMESFVYYEMLFDIYQSLLNNSSIEIFKLYYEENLTLQEIADNLRVSKSYIGKVIKDTEKKLDEFESKLHIYEKKKSLENLLEINDLEKIKKEISKMID